MTNDSQTIPLPCQWLAPPTLRYFFNTCSIALDTSQSDVQWAHSESRRQEEGEERSSRWLQIRVSIPGTHGKAKHGCTQAYNPLYCGGQTLMIGSSSCLPNCSFGERLSPEGIHWRVGCPSVICLCTPPPILDT